MLKELEALEWWLSPSGESDARCDGNPDPSCFGLVAKFARQQLNLRVDGEKLMEKLGIAFEDHWNGGRYLIANIPEDPEELASLVLECLTTDPLPTEQKED